jgi:hypothetical protein
LAIALNQAALLELERGHSARARRRASETLPIARLLERPSELLLALAILARSFRDLDDGEGYREHVSAIEAAAWPGAASTNARRRAEQLLGRPLTRGTKGESR